MIRISENSFSRNWTMCRNPLLGSAGPGHWFIVPLLEVSATTSLLPEQFVIPMSKTSQISSNHGQELLMMVL